MNDSIRNIVDRYMAGATTNDEEATLRSWFRLAGDDVPEEWRPLRAMLSFVDSERDMLASHGRHESESDGPHVEAILPKSTKRRYNIMFKPRFWISSAVAAAAVVAVFVLSPLVGGAGAVPQNYAVIDGKVYTSKKLVREQAMDALQTVSADADDPFSALDMMQ